MLSLGQYRISMGIYIEFPSTVRTGWSAPRVEVRGRRARNGWVVREYPEVVTSQFGITVMFSFRV